MGILLDNFTSDIIVILTTTFLLVHAYFSYCYTYWKRRNVPFISPSFPNGNCQSIYGEGVHFSLQTRYYYDLVKAKGLKYAGIYIMNRPILVLRDPEYIKDILTKDFQYFPNRNIYSNEEDDPISAHLFALRVPKWKRLRNILTPTFTSGKIKMMFSSVSKLCKQFTNALDKAAETGEDIDILDYAAKFTIDVVCTLAFGLDSNTFENPDSEFRRMSIRLFEIDNILEYLNLIIIGKAPRLASKLRLIGTRKDVSDYFHDIIGNVIKYRKENNIKRPDFLQSLTELMDNSAGSENPFTFKELVSECFVFFFASFDTSSKTMLFTLYELSKNQDIQDKVREEIKTVLKKYNDELTYDALAELQYMQQVIEESHRLYPPVTNLDRVCTKDYKLRNSEGSIGEGVNVLIPTFSLHRDPEYYRNPEIFDPERFNPENKKLRHPYLHLPFGEGPRICIGLRFGMMQTKIALTQMLKKFRYTLSPLTKPTLDFDDNSFFLKTTNTVYLKAEKI